MTLGGRCGDAKHAAYALEDSDSGADIVRLRLGEEVGDDPNVHGLRKGRVIQ